MMSRWSPDVLQPLLIARTVLMGGSALVVFTDSGSLVWHLPVGVSTVWGDGK